VTVAAADFRPPAPLGTAVAAKSSAVYKQHVYSSAPLRPEVLNAMRQLREMPPFAREREIDTGRYSHFSPEERELLRNLEE
jgi:hypothetical protein